MTSRTPGYHICDDWVSCEIEDQPTIYMVGDTLRKHRQWLEVVPGLGSLAVQFNSATISPGEAALRLKQQLQEHETTAIPRIETVEIPVCYDPSMAPDIEMIAASLKLPVSKLAQWHSKLQFSVTMLGFMPGFAYLDCDGSIENIGRLDQPRSKVAAGSIGIIGSQHCIYSFDSPGGWPIIGRTPLKLFNPDNKRPARLSPGQKINFSAIDIARYHELAGGDL